MQLGIHRKTREKKKIVNEEEIIDNDDIGKNNNDTTNNDLDLLLDDNTIDFLRTNKRQAVKRNATAAFVETNSTQSPITISDEPRLKQQKKTNVNNSKEMVDNVIRKASEIFSSMKDPHPRSIISQIKKHLETLPEFKDYRPEIFNSALNLKFSNLINKELVKNNQKIDARNLNGKEFLGNADFRKFISTPRINTASNVTNHVLNYITADKYYDKINIPFITPEGYTILIVLTSSMSEIYINELSSMINDFNTKYAIEIRAKDFLVYPETKDDHYNVKEYYKKICDTKFTAIFNTISTFDSKYRGLGNYDAVIYGDPFELLSGCDFFDGDIIPLHFLIDNCQFFSLIKNVFQIKEPIEISNHNINTTVSYINLMANEFLVEIYKFSKVTSGDLEVTINERNFNNIETSKEKINIKNVRPFINSNGRAPAYRNINELFYNLDVTDNVVYLEYVYNIFKKTKLTVMNENAEKYLFTYLDELTCSKISGTNSFFNSHDAAPIYKKQIIKYYIQFIFNLVLYSCASYQIHTSDDSKSTINNLKMKLDLYRNNIFSNKEVNRDTIGTIVNNLTRMISCEILKVSYIDLLIALDYIKKKSISESFENHVKNYKYRLLNMGNLIELEHVKKQNEKFTIEVLDLLNENEKLKEEIKELKKNEGDLVFDNFLNNINLSDFIVNTKDTNCDSDKIVYDNIEKCNIGNDNEDANALNKINDNEHNENNDNYLAEDDRCNDKNIISDVGPESVFISDNVLSPEFQESS